MAALPDCENLLHDREGGVLHVTFNRPAARHAMRTALLAEDAEIDLAKFLEAVAEFLVAIESQDAEFERDYAKMGDNLTPEQLEQVGQMRTMRAGAKAQMLEVQRYAESLR